MSGYLPLGGAGGGGSSSVSTVSAIAEDMFFTTTSGRDTWASGNPDRLYSGVACAVGSGSTYDYYMWDVQAGTWRDANLIYQGKRGEKGESGDAANGIVSQELSLSGKTLEQTTTLSDGTEIDSSVALEYLTSAEVQAKADAAEQAANSYTDEEIAKIPSGGGITIDLPDDTIPIIKDNKLVDSGLTAVDGSISTKPSSVYIGKDKFSSGGLNSFISDTTSNERYRIIRQNAETGVIEYIKNQGVQTPWANAGDKLGTIVYPNQNETPIDLPQEAEFITILESAVFKFELKESVTSDLVVELLELGQVISRKNVGTVEKGVIATNFPETDLRTDGIIEIRFHQKNGEPVSVAGTLNSPYIEFDYKTFEVGSLGTGGGSGGGVESVTVSYDEETRELLINVDGVVGSTQLDFIDAATLAETQQASLQQANQYTDSHTVDEVRHTLTGNVLETSVTLENGNVFSDSVTLPSGGGSGGFGVTDVKIGTIIGLADETVADDSMLACDGKQYAKTDYPELYSAIGDDYQSVDTEPDNFNVPRIENTRNVAKLADLSFDHLLNEYQSGLDPAEQQMAGIYAEGKARFVLANSGNIILGTVNDDRVDGTLIGSGYQYVNRFALAYENDSLHVLGVHLDKIYHSVIVDGEVTQSMIESTSPFHNPLFIVYMENASALIAVDRDRSGATLVKAAGVTLKQNGEIEIDETRKDFIAFPADVTPLNLCCTAAEGQGFRAVTIAGSDGHTHVFPLESFFLLFEFNTMISDIQITGISQSLPIRPLGTNVQYFCTDDKSLYTIHMGVTHQDRDTAYLEFHRNIVDPTDTENLSQPFVRDGEDSYKKAFIHHETGDIRVYKSEMDDVDFIVQNTSHFIKAKIDYTKSPIVENVSTTYEDSQLTVEVNGVASDPVTIQAGGGVISDTTMPMVTLEEVGNPTFSGSKTEIAAQFATLKYENSRQFQLKIFLSNNNNLANFLPSEKGGVLIFSNLEGSSDQLTTCTWAYYDRVGDVYMASLHSTIFQDFEKVTNTADLGVIDLRVDTLESKVQTLETLTQQQAEIIEQLQADVLYIQKNAYSGYALYSAEPNGLDMRMRHLDSGVDDDVQSVILDGTSPDPDDPDTPHDNKVYDVWHGWTKTNIDDLELSEFQNTSVQERTVTHKIYGNSYAGSTSGGEQYILDARYENTREQPTSTDDAAYMYIVFPAQITAREIKFVNYGGSNATWRGRDIVVDEVPYRIFMTDQVNIAADYDIGLSE